MHGAPFQQVQQHFADNLPTRPYCTDTLQHGVFIRPQAEALHARYLQWNPRFRVASILFDIDRDEGGAAWIDEGAPAPNWVVINPANGHAKIGYALAVPVTTSERGRPQPRDMLQRVEVGFTHWLKADPAFTGRVTNNPVHPAWITRSGTAHLYGLAELLDAMPYGITARKVTRSDLVSEGRNTTIFHDLRRWAYGQALAAREAGSYENWIVQLQEHAQALNTFDTPLPAREVQHIARSVGRWTWTNAPRFSASKLGGTKRSKIKSEKRERWTGEPVLTIQTSAGVQRAYTAEARERMVDGAGHTAQVKRSASRDRIVSAIGQLIAQGITNPSRSQIARAAGVSEATVKRFRASQNLEGKGN